MQIVIDIPEEIYNSACATNNIWDMRMAGFVCSAIANGTLLPKGHGRLIDADNIIPLALKEKTLTLKDTDLIDVRSREFIIDYLFKDIEDYINNMPTIIEADKAENEKQGMNKEESLSFLQSCIDKVNLATAQDIQFYREMYNKDCTTSIVEANKEENEE